MPVNRKIVVRFNFRNDPVLVERLGREDDIELVTCDRAAPDADALPHFKAAHVYHISSAKDELGKQWFATAELLAQCPNLVCVSTSGAGFDTVDVDACTKAGVIVVNQSGANAQAVAEHTIGLMIGVSKRITESDRRMRRELIVDRDEVMGRDISGKTVGIIGIGNIGRRTARLANAFEMTALAYDPYVSKDEIARRGAQAVSLDELLARSDFVTVHCPRTKETLDMIDKRAFSKMKKGAIFITTARGGIHNEPALYDALASGHLRGAGLDVWDKEPPPLDHPLLKLANVIATYHTAGVTHEARAAMASFAAEQIVEVLRAKHPPRLINPEVWPAYSKRFEALIGVPPQNRV
ncbi:MAG TPA: hydroxyacid dehydrogenase [Pseudolabrys sp.]|nr:hydroxyacid dehydrogenase [Pseudolabrys sp.]